MKQNFKNRINEVTFLTPKQLSPEAVKEYAHKKLHNGSYANCTVDKVFVNGQLVLENITIS